jgi:signal recognition particle receptor subunit beta
MLRTLEGDDAKFRASSSTKKKRSKPNNDDDDDDDDDDTDYNSYGDASEDDETCREKTAKRRAGELQEQRRRLVPHKLGESMWNNKCLVKITIVGDKDCGKSSLFRRLMYDSFVSEPSHTREPDVGFVYARLYDDNENDVTKIMINDVPGDLYYRWNIPAYTRDVDGIMMVFDVTKQASFLSLREQPGDTNLASNWKKVADSGTLHCYRMMLATKRDLIGKPSPKLSATAWFDTYTREEMNAYARSLASPGRSLGMRRVSSLTGQGVLKAFFDLARKARADPESFCNQRDGTVVTFNGQQIPKGNKRCGC